MTKKKEKKKKKKKKLENSEKLVGKITEKVVFGFF
jgi:hypothetical protein